MFFLEKEKTSILWVAAAQLVNWWRLFPYSRIAQCQLQTARLDVVKDWFKTLLPVLPPAVTSYPLFPVHSRTLPPLWFPSHMEQQPHSLSNSFSFFKTHLILLSEAWSFLQSELPQSDIDFSILKFKFIIARGKTRRTTWNTDVRDFSPTSHRQAPLPRLLRLQTRSSNNVCLQHATCD